MCIRDSASTLDTCCGAGCMLLAAAAAYDATHKDRSCRQDMLFVGQDLDQVVALMCYIQLSILGYAGYAVSYTHLQGEWPGGHRGVW